MNRAEYKLDLEDHRRILTLLEEEMLLTSQEEAVPQIFILGGQPGSGKSVLAKHLTGTLFNRESVVVINGDDYRNAHPEFMCFANEDEMSIAALTDHDVRRWTRDVLSSAVAHRRSIIFECTLRSAHPIAETIQSLYDTGYAVTVAVMSTPKVLSSLGILIRYGLQKSEMGYGRWTSSEYHDIAYDALPSTVREIESHCPLHRMLVYTREGELLYANERKDGIFSVPPTGEDACSAIEEYRAKPLTSAQQGVLEKEINQILRLMQDRRTNTENTPGEQPHEDPEEEILAFVNPGRRPVVGYDERNVIRRLASEALKKHDFAGARRLMRRIPRLSTEDCFKLNHQAINAMNRDDYDEVNRLLKMIPLSLVNANMLKRTHGAQWIIDEGWDLSQVLEAYGPEWFDN